MATATTPNPCTLHRLDASRGVLLAAGQWLLEHACRIAPGDLSDVTVVVPGRRAGNRLLEVLLDLTASQSLVLVPPLTATLGTLPEMLYTPVRPLADDAIETLAWAAALTAASPRDLALVAPGVGSLRGELEKPLQGPLVDAARSLVAVHRELAKVGLGFDAFAEQADTLMPGFGDHARWEAMARLERTYLDGLAAEGFWDRQTARRVAIERKEVTFENRIVLLATVDIDPLQRQLLEQVTGSIDALVAVPPEFSAADVDACFDAFGCIVPDAWQGRHIPIPLNTIALVNDTDGQAAAIIDWLQRFAGQYSADQITIAVPDDQVAPAIEQHLTAAGITGRYGAGRTVRRSNPWQMFSAVFGWLARGDFESLATLLRSADVLRLVTRQTGIAMPIALADAVAARHLPMTIDREHLARAADRPSDTQENLDFIRVLDAIDHWLAPLRKVSSTSDHVVPVWLWTDTVRATVATALDGVSLDRDAPHDRVTARSLKTLGETLSDMATIPTRLAIGSTALAQLLLTTWGKEPMPPMPIAESIDIVGWLEVALDDAPLLAITSAVEGSLPTSTAPDPLLPDPLRKALSLEDAGRIAARDAWILSVAASCREHLLVIVPQHRTDATPAIPSRLLFRREPDEIVTASRRFFTAVEPEITPMAPPAAASRLIVPQPWASPVTTMRVTEFKDYLACPYRYWLRHRLRLVASTDCALELGPADFGTLIHECLDRFAKNRDLTACTDATLIATTLSDILDAFVHFRYGRNAASAVAVQAELARRRLHAFAAVQAQRAAEGWRVVITEHHVKAAMLDVDGEPLALSARIDRIDHHPESDRWQVLDYKTSAKAKTPDQTHRKWDEWIDLQLPLYRHLLAEVPGFPCETRAESGQANVEVGYFNVPARLEEAGIRVATWNDGDYADADAAARWVVRQVRSGIFWPPIDAASKSFPEFDAICQTHAILEDASSQDSTDDGESEEGSSNGHGL